jgi:Xaa-Pro aminopeptidase
MAWGEEYLRKILRRKELDALVFWSLENIRYLCGFTGSDGALIVTSAGERIFLSDSRYEEQARKQVREAAFQKYRQKIKGVANCLVDLGVKRAGFESAAVPYDHYEKLRENLPRLSWRPVAEDLKGLRVRKHPEEIDIMRRAARIAAESFQDLQRRIRPGAGERTLAEFLECRMKRRGGDKPAFDTIVASGERGALPHGAPSQRRLRAGESVVIDFGTRFQGYHSDETKTVVLGNPTAQMRRVYSTVRRAQEKALRAIRPGINVREIDRAARGVIEAAGYGKFFGHGTGHGVGLAVHEEPVISPLGRGVVEEGMVFTVEPGIYIPEWGGVRLEDMVLVTSRGWELLTSLSKNLKENIIPC